MAFAISLETNETLDYVIWEMPLAQVFTLIPMITAVRTGEKYDTKFDRLSRRKRMQILQDNVGNQNE